MRDTLTAREMQVTELLAWGAERKEVPSLLLKLYGGKKEISLNTVNNIVANIYTKLSLQNEKELAAWYFCECQGVDWAKSPLKQLRRTLYALFFLILILPQLTSLDVMIRPAGARAATSAARAARGVRSTGRTYRLGRRKD